MTQNNKILKAILTIGITATILLSCFIGYQVIQDKRKLVAPDMVNKTKNEVLEFCNGLSNKYECEIIYESSNSIPVDRVISQSIKAGELVENKIQFVICNELIKQIALPDLSKNLTKDDIDYWAKGNNIKKLKYIEEESDTVKKGQVIKIEPAEIYSDSSVTVYISIEKKQEEVKEENKQEENDIYISSGKYIGKTEDEFIKIAKELELKPVHISSRDEYSDTVSKGNIVTHGSGYYIKNEDFNYGLSLGKKNNESQNEDLYISKDKYVDKTEEDFIKIAKDLGLKPTHKSDRDDYSDTIKKGSILTHGYGYYEPNEDFNYGLSLGKKNDDSQPEDLYITKDKYVGKTEEEFKKIANDLGLKPTHKSDRDDYSDTIKKGSILTHGYGYYEQNEAFNYGLSLGPKSSGSNQGNNDSNDKNIIVDSYAGKTESEFLSYLETNGLKAGTRTEQYSSTVEKGKIISNDTGTKKQGDYISYKVSKGKEGGDTISLISKGDFANLILSTGSYDEAVNKAKDLLKNAGFTNYTFKGSKSTDSGAGVLLSITVNGKEHIKRAEYSKDADIVITISTGLE